MKAARSAGHDEDDAAEKEEQQDDHDSAAGNGAWRLRRPMEPVQFLRIDAVGHSQATPSPSRSSAAR